jgi:hypothetical protein
VPADDPRCIVEGSGGQRQRGTVKQHEEAPGWMKLVVVTAPTTRGFSISRGQRAVQ